MNNKFLLRTEEFVLVFLILLNLFDFLELLSSELDYIKKIISFTLIFYLFYRVSLSTQFFGRKDENFDFLLIFGMFILSLKDFIAIAVVSEPGYFTPFFQTLVNNNSAVQTFAFITGLIWLIALSFYAGKIHLKKPCLMHLLHEHQKEKFWHKVIMNYLVFLAFYLFIFNLIIEWLAIAIDAPIISFALIIYLLIAWRKHSLNKDSLLYKIANAGEDFYDYFMQHFRYKKTLILGIAGMLVLHMITDIAVFILPAIFGIRDALYEPIFSTGHQTLLQIAAFAAKNSAEFVAYLLQYLLATLGLLMLIITPSRVWFSSYVDKKLHLGNTYLSLFYLGLLALLVTPIFVIMPLTKYFAGVDIQTIAIIINPYFALILELVFFLLIYFTAKRLAQAYTITALFLSSSFFLWYIIIYFFSILNFYRLAVFETFLNGSLFISLHLFLFFVLSIIFYVGGFWFYILALKKKITIV